MPYNGELKQGLVLLGLVYDGQYPRQFSSWYISEPGQSPSWENIDDGRGVGINSIELKNGALNCSVTTYSSNMYICVVPPIDFPTT